MFASIFDWGIVVRCQTFSSVDDSKTKYSARGDNSRPHIFEVLSLLTVLPLMLPCVCVCVHLFEVQNKIEKGGLVLINLSRSVHLLLYVDL